MVAGITRSALFYSKQLRLAEIFFLLHEEKKKQCELQTRGDSFRNGQKMKIVAIKLRELSKSESIFNVQYTPLVHCSNPIELIGFIVVGLHNMLSDSWP